MRYLVIIFTFLAYVAYSNAILSQPLKTSASAYTTEIPEERIQKILDAHDVPGMSYI